MLSFSVVLGTIWYTVDDAAGVSEHDRYSEEPVRVDVVCPLGFKYCKLGLQCNGVKVVEP